MMPHLCDAHCHFFSSRFLELLTKDVPGLPAEGRARHISMRLGWEDPGGVEGLSDRWNEELERNGVARAVLIASIPDDEESVASAVARHPSRFVGFFMLNPVAPDATERLARALTQHKLKGVALFPAMHHFRMDDERVEAVFETARSNGAAVFVHCGTLTVGVRKKLGLPSLFDLRLGDPLAVARTAVRFGTVPVIIPHFGAGFLKETLMAADQCPTIHLDTSSSNSWMRYHPRLTLDQVFRQALDVVGTDRLLFGTDSSFFPRGWQRSIHDAQRAALTAAGASEDVVGKIMGGNFERIFPV
jgi:predicted TIM-barrel fold metal-dependent hydrolase